MKRNYPFGLFGTVHIFLKPFSFLYGHFMVSLKLLLSSAIENTGFCVETAVNQSLKLGYATDDVNKVAVLFPICNAWEYRESKFPVGAFYR